MITLIFSKFYGCKVYFTTFWYNLKYISYIVKIGGGGGYVVKTYPSIDPIVAPPILITSISVTFIIASVT